MKFNRYIAALGLPLLALGACETDIDHDAVFDSTNAVPAELSIKGTAQEVYTLDKNNASAEVFTIQWTAPDMGVKVPATNILQMDLDGHDFANAQVLTTETESTVTTYTPIASDLNPKLQTILLRYGLETPTTEAEALDVAFRMVTFITGSQSDSIYSDVLTVKILPYEGEAAYPEMFLIGDYCGWSGTNAQTQNLFSFSGDEVNYEGIVDFDGKAANGFKITDVAPVGNWSNCEYNLGIGNGDDMPEAEASSFTLFSNGGNITCYSKRFYHFSFDKSTLTLTKNESFDKIVLAGSGDGLSWDMNSKEFEFDPETQKFYIDQTFAVNDRFKVLYNNGSEVWLGEVGNGKLGNGNDIVITAAGNYRIYVNLNNSGSKTYELSTDDYGK